ncbi:hypothetical protein YK56LOC_33330 [Caballeronia sp. HLA56]
MPCVDAFAEILMNPTRNHDAIHYATHRNSKKDNARQEIGEGVGQIETDDADSSKYNHLRSSDERTEQLFLDSVVLSRCRPRERFVVISNPS